MLHGRRVEVAADSCEQRLTLVPVVAPHANLDQLVGQQVDVDFVEHGGREPVVADADERMQGMRFRAEGAPRRGC